LPVRTTEIPQAFADLRSDEAMVTQNPLTLSMIRAQLSQSGGGHRYWRTLEELAGTDEFRDFLHREFPREASVWDDAAIDRRRFFQIMAASLALAGFAGGCRNQGEEKILPYVRAPEQIVPGKSLHYATTMPMGTNSIGLLVTSREGRPIKIEGNEVHPASLGTTDAWAQASILSLYDPDRSQTVMHLGEISTWDAFLAELRGNLEPRSSSGGKGIYVLSESVTSPTLARQMREFQERYPNARWHQYEPINRDTAREAARLSFGRDATAVYDFTKAKAVLALDSDFLCQGPGSVRYARDFMRGRNVRGEQVEMNGLYVVESTCSGTGTAADHRLPVRPSEVGRFALELARKLGVSEAESLGDGARRAEGEESEWSRWLNALAEDLQANRGASVVLAGDQHPAWVHALVHAMNARLGNHGATIQFIEPVDADPAEQYDSLRQLADSLAGDQVELLVILGGNPVYNAPGELRFEELLSTFAKKRNSNLAVHFSLYDDETSELCHWHIPAAHYLESWSDARCFDGTTSIVQPLIDPLYDGKSIHEMLSAMTDRAVKPPYDIVRATWQRSDGGEANLDDRGWRKAVHDGVIDGTSPERISLAVQLDPEALRTARESSTNAASGNGQLEIAILPDPAIFDGRFANNAWLQELPKPITKLTWDNAILLSQATAARLAAANGDVVRLTRQGRAIDGPVWIVPGHPDDSATVHLGYGRTRGGRVLEGAGFSAYPLLPANGQRIGAGATVDRTGDKAQLACTQHHHLLEGLDVEAQRNIVHTGTLAAYERNPKSIHGAAHGGGHGGAEHAASFYPEFKASGFQWGMAIDMNACTGCNACVVACQAENNVPVVGKQGVINGREMHWLRLDLYYEGNAANPQAVHQPMLCQHCEKAPCEVVCPVMATTHSGEGLNEMTYNRCVGTRYCSNNCPYKVRRFNFLEYNAPSEPVLKLLYNPEVTVRSRGVMEKCSYCVQRINAARIAAKIDQIENGGELAIKDGALQTACQQVCPTQAIVFGNINDPDSQVAKLKHHPLNYGVLSEIGTQPRTTYLARVRNTNSSIT
jgi:molybdopterin-containing oxidoreductase family iron-sulfur binding subunit